jgi:hypothetical protein
MKDSGGAVPEVLNDLILDWPVINEKFVTLEKTCRDQMKGFSSVKAILDLTETHKREMLTLKEEMRLYYDGLVKFSEEHSDVTRLISLIEGLGEIAKLELPDSEALRQCHDMVHC